MLLTCSSRMSSICLVARLPGWMTHHSPVAWPPVTQSIWKQSSGPTSKYRGNCISVTHACTRICASQHTTTYFRESAEKHTRTHMCTEKPTFKVTAHSHVHTDTWGSQKPRTNTHTLSRVHTGRQTDRRGAAVTGAALLLIPIRIHSCCVLSAIL